MHDAAHRMPSYRTLGALCEGEETTFRVWAPEHECVELVIDAGYPAATDAGGVRGRSTRPAPAIRPLAPDGCGCWCGRFRDVRPGARYKYRLDRDDARTFPDPASRFQPEGVHGASQVVDASRFSWTDERWAPPSPQRLIIYELHVGTFSAEGTYRGAAARLPHLVDLGITAMELMPVADFPGRWNWGYDGVSIFAPARCYGTPDELRALVDTAHRLGLAVLLDVVYNHLGPDGAYANAFSRHYFTDAHRSPWGRGVNLDGPHSGQVRRFFIENALHWVNEYHIDGLRLDATHAMRDDGPRHFLEELTSTVRAHARRPVVVIAEDERNLATLVEPCASGGYGIDAVWADDFHHQARVHTAGDRESYYADYSGTAADLAETLRNGWFFTGQHSRHLGAGRGTDPSRIEPHQFVICAQNHDQVGNRANGARLHHEIDPAAYRALSVMLMLAPQTPLLFMGQEWAASTPFLFFTDHHEELGRQITAGRRDEFRAFAAFADAARRATIPDPQSGSTFESSRLHWDEIAQPPHAGVYQLYRRVARLRLEGSAVLSRTRRSYTVRAIDPHTVAFCYIDDALLVVARLSGGGKPVRIPVAGGGEILLTTEDPDIVSDAAAPTVTRSASSGGNWTLGIDFQRPGAIVFRATLGA